MFTYLMETERALLTVGVFLGTYFVSLTIGRLLKRRAGVRLGILFQLFALTLAFYAGMRAFGVKTTWGGHVGAAVVLLSTALVVALVDRYVWDYYYETRRKIIIPRLLREFAAAIVFLIALLLVLSVGYGAQTELKGILAGSGVIAIILGFSMQNLLSTVVAGAELQIGRPYRLGDWLQVGEHIGKVTEINWADTRLKTNDAISIEIPNNKIVEGTIINFSFPTPLHAMRLQVGAEYSVQPNRVKDAIRRAAANAPGMLLDPPPKVFLKDFGESSITYELKFWMNGHETYNDLCDAIRTNIWYEFRRQKIMIPFPIRTLQVDRRDKTTSKQTEAARAVLRQQALFTCLSDEQVEGLLKGSDIQKFGRGEVIIEEGTEGDSMFILTRGSALVSVDKEGTPIRVGALRVGDCFGEMSLLTGAKRTATVRAEKDCEVLEVGKAIMGDLLRATPACLDQLSSLLAQRKMETEGIVKEAAQVPSEQAQKKRDYTASFIKRLKSFFEL